MKQEAQNEISKPKERITVWLYPPTIEVLDKAFTNDNCKSRSEFIEKAIQFYAGYISGEDATAFLPRALVSAIRGTLEDSENHMARLLFKLAVEMSMMMNVLAAGMEIDERELHQIRAYSVDEVKRTHGNISLADTVKATRNS